MNKLEKLETYLEELTNTINHVKVLISEEKETAEKEVKCPKHGDIYWFISCYGNVFEEEWGNSYGDNARKNFIGIFRTKEEAERQAKRLRIMRQLDELADGGDYYLAYDDIDAEFITLAIESRFCGSPWRFSFEKAKEVRETIGEDNLKLVFNVEGK